ncbi:MAG TPA: magnesium chelatase domain-containing protein, partial [Coxiellaceae bacterium]|nr:magnesium chelatase domain-containing protein [Coxiellaceae bacterium]
MALAIVYSRALLGVEAPSVRVEVHLTGGTARFNMVGLPEAVVKESKDRVRSAIINSRFSFPHLRITVNLAPADLPKEGGRFDLAIALGILVASGQLKTEILNDYEFAGELALSGELRPIKGILSFALAVRAAKRKLILPSANVEEATLVSGLGCIAGRDLLQVCAHLSGQHPLDCQQVETSLKNFISATDLSEVKGQVAAKRALEIAASGAH